MKNKHIMPIYFFSGKNQKWKLNDDKLENKEGLWKSIDSWKFQSIRKDVELFYIIENTSTSKTMVWGTTSDGTVIQEVFVEGKADQLWKKGKPDAEGYFTLENSGVPKVITAITENGLEIKGNIRQGQSFRYLTVH